MDGIFGVGLAEVILIGLVLFIVGGPENTAKWARELGRWVRMGREALSDALAQLEKEMGDDGKEIVDAAREVGQEFREVRQMTSARGWLQSSVTTDNKPRQSALAPDAKPEPITPSDDAQDSDAAQKAGTAQEEASPEANGKDTAYSAWLPREE